MSIMSDLYNILTTSLQIIPKAIIDTIILKYYIGPNLYDEKYTKFHYDHFTQIHYNPFLDIICCKCYRSNKFKLLDYWTGTTHDESKIDIKQFNTCINGSFDIIYFNNNIMLSRSNHTTIHRYILKDTKYELTHINKHMHYNDICVYNNCIYIVISHDNKYCIRVYDVNDLRKLTESYHFEYGNILYDGQLHMSVHDDIIYIYEDHFDYNNIYFHNIINLNRFHQHKNIRKYSDAQLYQDKLYYHESNEICIYDMISLERVYTFNPHSNEIKHILLSNNVIMLSGDHIFILYDIK
jgi:hypothetical protein